MSVPTSRRRLPPAQRRREILEVATSLIATSGFNGIPLGRFAEACGMTKAALLHYFASKEDLLVAVLERRDELDAFAVAPDRVPATDAASSSAPHAARAAKPQPAVDRAALHRFERRSAGSEPSRSRVLRRAVGSFHARFGGVRVPVASAAATLRDPGSCLSRRSPGHLVSGPFHRFRSRVERFRRPALRRSSALMILAGHGATGTSEDSSGHGWANRPATRRRSHAHPQQRTFVNKCAGVCDHARVTRWIRYYCDAEDTLSYYEIGEDAGSLPVCGSRGGVADRECPGRPPSGRPGHRDQATSNRSRFMTLSQAATKSRTNFSRESSLA
jgi:AcrR family transcriptional regulator